MTTRERIESPFGSPDPPRDELSAAPARLALRALTGWEEEYVERHASQPNTARLCNEILARCLVTPGEDPGAARATVRELLVAERDRELVALRRLSLGPNVSAVVPCPQCGEQSEADFSLDVLPLDFDVPREHVRIDVDGVGEAELRLPNAGDQEELLEVGLDGESERRSWLLARCLQRYGERTGGFDRDFARGLPVAVRGALEAALEKRLPDLELEMAVECSHCGAPIVAPFDVPSFFFFELSGHAKRLLRDVHQLARAYGWSERDIVTLTLDRRLAYGLLLEEERDGALLADLVGDAG